ncbi:ribonuclease 3-like protein 2 [Oryza brachyantha]|uniref:RNase III domain-containing protein n=1 Tax=Oryza brachyantha TaxID=4533 RepID=J3L0Z2_ORYBR|nr:ribonuclease 3-like protein 2 [Oryza brachyantha]
MQRQPAAAVGFEFEADRKAAARTVERALGYRFRDRALLDEALTHSSWPPARAPTTKGGGGEGGVGRRRTYQRLEFVGDAALGLAFSGLFYREYPDLGPGVLTELRSANTSNEKLARAAVRHGLYRLLRRHNCDRLDLRVSHFTVFVNGNVPYNGQVVEAPKVLADIVEAIAGAVYVDCKFDLKQFQKVVEKLCSPIIFEETLCKDPVSMLKEHCEKHNKALGYTESDSEYTESIGVLKVANVIVHGELVGIGSAKQMRVARRNAARDAVATLRLVGGEERGVATAGCGFGDGAGEDEAGKVRLRRWFLLGAALWLCFKLLWE